MSKPYLIAATHTPMDASGEINFAAVPKMVDFVLGQGADGLFLCGSTGEFPSLSTEERMEVTQAFFESAKGRAPIYVHVGHSNLQEARALAAHAAKIGVDAIAAAPPSYFRPTPLEALVDSLVYIAQGAPDMPLYYYHIPPLTGVNFRMAEFLERADKHLPSLAGIKFSSAELDDLVASIHYGDGRYTILFGCDEMLLAGLAMGAAGAVGSTYNFFGPQYRSMLEAFNDGRLEDAQQFQLEVTRKVHQILKFGGANAIKAAMSILGVDVGPPRLPLKALNETQRKELERLLRP